MTVTICGIVRLFAVNPGGYIGVRVKREIEYARSHGKYLMFLE